MREREREVLHLQLYQRVNLYKSIVMKTASSSCSSAFPAISLGFTMFGEIFCVCDRFLIQPKTWSHSVFVDMSDS